jgi:hypothetical protein
MRNEKREEPQARLAVIRYTDNGKDFCIAIPVVHEPGRNMAARREAIEHAKKVADANVTWIGWFDHFEIAELLVVEK